MGQCNRVATLKEGNDLSRIYDRSRSRSTNVITILDWKGILYRDGPFLIPCITVDGNYMKTLFVGAIYRGHEYFLSPYHRTRLTVSNECRAPCDITIRIPLDRYGGASIEELTPAPKNAGHVAKSFASNRPVINAVASVRDKPVTMNATKTLRSG